MEKLKLLFVCSQNKRRSLTAEKMFKDNPDFDVKSAGTENNARVKITLGMIRWADLIFLMERKHRDRLKQHYPEDINPRIRNKTCITFNVPDDFTFMQPELIEILEDHLAEHFDF
jgi:predicted protein tyrosine phosphatase